MRWRSLLASRLSSSRKASEHPKPLNLHLTIAGQQDADTWGQARIYGAIGWGGMHLVLGPLLLP